MWGGRGRDVIIRTHQGTELKLHMQAELRHFLAPGWLTSIFSVLGSEIVLQDFRYESKPQFTVIWEFPEIFMYSVWIPVGVTGKAGVRTYMK